MLDLYNRQITYLRISVTDRCNLRCTYCMPESGILLKQHEDILSFDEIIEVVKTGVNLGISKIRITGGEPLVRKGIISLIQNISLVKGVEDLALTTNGILLHEFAQPLKNAGLHRVNISLDTLDPDTYSNITRGGNIHDVLKGIQTCKQVGLKPIKINTVIFDSQDTSTKEQMEKFAQEQNIEIRFIQKMDLETGNFSVVEGGTGGNCSICNRLRLTADGYVKPCLFSELGFNVRKLGAEEAIRQAILYKPEKGIECHNHQFYNIGG